MKIAVAFSGGVDSLYALKWAMENFDNVVAVYLDFLENKKKIEHIREITNKLKVPLQIYNCKKEFKENIIDYFINEYLSGRTPNPCVKCNTIFKFQYILDRFDRVVTGHYAKIVNNFIYKAKDKKKDQSYFLARIPSESLKSIIFPLGDVKKEDINIANKKESQDICFIPDNDYKNFIIKNRSIKPKKGFIKDRKGKVIGTHKGFFNFTIGQRKGLNIAMGTPYYVLKINAKENTVYAGSKEETICKKFSFSNPLWYDNYEKYENLKVKVRYRSKEKSCELSSNVVKFIEEESSVTPGQLAVFYSENKIIGSGWIENVD